MDMSLKISSKQKLLCIGNAQNGAAIISVKLRPLAPEKNYHPRKRAQPRNCSRTCTSETNYWSNERYSENGTEPSEKFDNCQQSVTNRVRYCNAAVFVNQISYKSETKPPKGIRVLRRTAN